MNAIIREFTNALLDVERIAHSVVRYHLGQQAWTEDLVNTITGAYARKRRFEVQYEVIGLLTDPIPLIPMLTGEA